MRMPFVRRHFFLNDIANSMIIYGEHARGVIVGSYFIKRATLNYMHKFLDACMKTDYGIELYQGIIEARLFDVTGLVLDRTIEATYEGEIDHRKDYNDLDRLAAEKASSLANSLGATVLLDHPKRGHIHYTIKKYVPDEEDSITEHEEDISELLSTQPSNRESVFFPVTE